MISWGLGDRTIYFLDSAASSFSPNLCYRLVDI